MKKIISIIALLIISEFMYAQETVSATLPISVKVMPISGIADPTLAVLENKLMQVLTNNGIGGCDYNTQFMLTADVKPLTKDIVPGPPTQYAYTYNISFYIVDNQAKTVLSSISQESKGVDTSAEKAMVNAFRSIRTNTSEFTSFVDTAREKIVAYYDNNGKLIVDKANNLANMKNYEEALYLLNTVPTISKWFELSCDAAVTIYKKYENFKSEEYLARARSAWNACQDIEGAKVACSYLSLITPNVSAYKGAQNLYEEISSRVKSIVEYPWKLDESNVDLEKHRINAWRDVGVAYGQNQKADANTLMWLIR